MSTLTKIRLALGAMTIFAALAIAVLQALSGPTYVVNLNVVAGDTGDTDW